MHKKIKFVRSNFCEKKHVINGFCLVTRVLLEVMESLLGYYSSNHFSRLLGYYSSNHFSRLLGYYSSNQLITRAQHWCLVST